MTIAEAKNSLNTLFLPEAPPNSLPAPSTPLSVVPASLPDAAPSAVVTTASSHSVAMITLISLIDSKKAESVNVPLSTTIGQLKEIARDRLNIMVSFLMLYGTKLEASKTLADYKIVPNDYKTIKVLSGFGNCSHCNPNYESKFSCIH